MTSCNMASYQSAAYLWAEKQAEVAPQLAQKVEIAAGSFWDKFYKRNTNKFYKDRHYFGREWPMLCSGAATVLEVGCGVGNTVFPLLDMNPQLKVYACDFAPTAIDLVKTHPNYASGCAHAFVADLTVTDLVQQVPAATVDFVTMVFVLSAVAPHKMPAAVANVARTLRPGGHILFRDYAQGDLAQERRELAGARKLSERFFLRGDGTCCFHFQPQELLSLFQSAGMTCVDIHIHKRDVVNKKRGIVMQRQWLQAVFQLTSTPPPFPPPPGAMPAFSPTKTNNSTDDNTHMHIPVIQMEESIDMDADEDMNDEDEDEQHDHEGDVQMQGCDHQQPPPHTPQPAAPCNVASAAGGGVSGGGGGQVRSPGAAAMLFHSGTLLTGAAGRLASHAAALPGVPSGRAQLPDTLDSADELASSLSPGACHVPGQGQGHTWATAGGAAGPAVGNGGVSHGGGHAKAGIEQLEADLEREFFSTIARDTQEVVAEELAAAGIAGITLADVGGTTTDTATASIQQQPQHRTWAAVSANSTGNAAGVVVAQGAGNRAAYEILIAPGMQLACTHPTLVSMASGASGHPGEGLRDAAAAHAELLLARLLASCCANGPGKGSLLAQCMHDGVVLQLGAGPGALSGMLAVRWGGARRVLLTHPDRATLSGCAGCVHANAARLIVERIKVAQLDLNSDVTIHNVLSHVSQYQGASVVVCADVEAALGTAAAGLSHTDACKRLLQVCSLAASGAAVERPSVVKSLVASRQGTSQSGAATGGSTPHRPACLVLLLPAALVGLFASQAAQDGQWVVDSASGQQLSGQLDGAASGLGLEPMCLVWTGSS